MSKNDRGEISLYDKKVLNRKGIYVNTQTPVWVFVRIFWLSPDTQYIYYQ
jgi:hypothetical protein